MTAITITTADQAKAKIKAQFQKRLTEPELQQIINMYCIEEASEKRGAAREKKLGVRQLRSCQPNAVQVVVPKYDPDIPF